MSNLNSTVARNIESARRIAKKTTKELARAMSVTEMHYRDWESGKRLPALDELVMLAQLLDVTPHDLLGWEG